VLVWIIDLNMILLFYELLWIIDLNVIFFFYVLLRIIDLNMIFYFVCYGLSTYIWFFILCVVMDYRYI
jgi:hypothetical protein